MAKNDTPAETPAPLDINALATEGVFEETPAPVVVADEVMAFVHRAHDFWKITPKKWRKVRLSSEKAVADVIGDASKYARSIGRTFRVKKQDDATLLVYKVTDGVRKTKADTPTSPSSIRSRQPLPAMDPTGNNDG